MCSILNREWSVTYSAIILKIDMLAAFWDFMHLGVGDKLGDASASLEKFLHHLEKLQENKSILFARARKGVRSFLFHS